MVRHILHSLTLAIAVATCLGAAPLHAEEPMTVHERGEVRFITGGVSDKEQKALMKKADDYDLQLTFAREDNGAYLAGVELTIRDAKGRKVLQTEARGPLLLADLPDGRYRVQAEAEGWQAETHRFRIGKERQVVHITLKKQ